MKKLILALLACAALSAHAYPIYEDSLGQTVICTDYTDGNGDCWYYCVWYKGGKIIDRFAVRQDCPER